MISSASAASAKVAARPAASGSIATRGSVSERGTPGRGLGHPPAHDERVEDRPLAHREDDEPEAAHRPDHPEGLEDTHGFADDGEGDVVAGAKLLGLDDDTGRRSPETMSRPIASRTRPWRFSPARPVGVSAIGDHVRAGCRSRRPQGFL